MMQYSTFGSMSTVGAMFGGLWSGKIADVIGRKGVNVIVFPYVSSKYQGFPYYNMLRV